MSKVRLKRLHQEKQRIAAAFREARSQQAIEALKTEMSAVSAELKALQAALKAQRHAGEPAPANTAATADENELPTIPAHLRLAAPPGDMPTGSGFENLSDINRKDWDAYVTGSQRATLCHDSRWLRIIENQMRQRSLSLLLRSSDGRVCGVLPLYRLRSRLFGDFGVSVPYLNYGGAVGDNAGIESALMNEAARRAHELGLEHVEFRDHVHRDGWPVRDDKVSMIRRLPASVGALDTELGTKVRAQIQRAAREEAVTVHLSDGAADLAAFYAVFARNMRDLGTPVYASGLFAAILSHWPDDAWLIIVRVRGRPVGGAFLLRHRDTLEIPWASTLREYNPLGINMLMYHRALESGIDAGCRYFDFGRSSRDSGTYRFKRQWGAAPVPHYWHYWLRQDAQMPGLNPDNPRYRLLIRIWQRLPVPVTRLIGPPIVRNLP